MQERKGKNLLKGLRYQPTAHWVVAYDCMNLFLTAIKEVGPNSVAIRDWMATKANGRPGLAGPKGRLVNSEMWRRPGLVKRGYSTLSMTALTIAQFWLTKKANWSGRSKGRFLKVLFIQITNK